VSILKKGMSGAPVKRLQARLDITADGIFGPGTEKAVRDFQKSAGLVADGIAGPDTFSALGLGELVLLRVGTRGETVKKLQNALGITADGIFGKGTEKAVRAFQSENGLAGDGLAGPETLAKIEAFSGITQETVEKAALQPDEQAFESEPMPELDGTHAVVASAEELPPNRSVWSKVKGWFS